MMNLENLFDKAHNNTNIINYNIQEGNTDWLKYLNVKKLPKEINLSNISFSETSFPNDMFLNLVKIYIGKRYVELVK